MRLKGLMILGFFLMASFMWAAENAITFHYDFQRTGRTTNVATRVSNVLWSFKTLSSVEASPVVDADGTIYVASTDKQLYALTSAGAEKWNFEAHESIFSTPTLVNGTLYFGDIDGWYYALSTTRTLKWSFRLPDEDGPERRILTPPAVDSNGAIYLAAWNNFFYKISPDGTIVWKAKLAGLPTAAPALDGEGNIYVASLDNGVDDQGNPTDYNVSIYRFAPGSNTPVWKYQDWWAFNNRNRVISTPAIDLERGLILVGACVQQEWSEPYTNGGALYGVHLNDGSQAFRTDLPLGTTSSPAFSADGTAYIGCLDGKLYAVDLVAGAIQWSYKAEGLFVMGAPVVDGEGSILFGDSDGTVYCLSKTGRLQWDLHTVSNIQSAPVIASDGTVYVTSYDGRIYAIGGSPRSLWHRTQSHPRSGR